MTRTTTRAAVLAGGLAVIGLAMGACGGSPVGARDGAASQASGAATPAGAATSDTTPAAAAGGSGGAVCDLIRTYRQRLEDLDQQGLGDPGRLRQFMASLTSALDQAVQVAPADVRADITLIRNATKDYNAMLSGAGYDVTKLTRGTDNPLLHADVQAASERQDAYARATCGVQD